MLPKEKKEDNSEENKLRANKILSRAKERKRNREEKERIQKLPKINTILYTLSKPNDPPATIDVPPNPNIGYVTTSDILTSTHISSDVFTSDVSRNKNTIIDLSSDTSDAIINTTKSIYQPKQKAMFQHLRPITLTLISNIL